MQQIFIRVVGRKNDPISWLIRLFTRSWASHAEFLVVQDGTPTERFGSNWPEGVRFRTYDTKGVVREEWYSAPKIDEAFRWAVQNLNGRSYNLKAVLGIGLDQNWTNSREDFCSQVIDASFRNVGAPILEDSDRPWEITPRDLTLSPLMHLEREIYR